MLPMVTTVGPLASSSATKIAAAQSTAGAQFLVLNGGAQVGTATNISAAHTYGAAGNVTLNGSTTQGSPAFAFLGANTYIYFTDAANDSTVTATITGTQLIPSGSPLDLGAVGVSETVTLSNSTVISSVNQYYTVTQIALSGATTGNLSVGTYGPITLDVARQILFTPAGADSALTYTISGTDWSGLPISETVQGVNNPSTATSLLSYLTINSIKVSGATASTMTVGTNGVAYSPWVSFDPLSGMGPTSIQVNGTGTVNWSVQQTLDDPNSVRNAVALAKMNWVNHPDPNMVSSAVTTGVQSNYAYPPAWARVLLNSGSGTVTATFIQNHMS